MKKLLLILIALGTTTLSAQYGGNTYTGATTTASTSYGASASAYVNVNAGATYSTGGAYGGMTTTCAPAPVATCAPTPTCAPVVNCATERRVRWEASPCGTFKWRIEEVSYWVPGQWTWSCGNRVWTEGYMAWNVVDRTKVYPQHTCYNGCGHGYGTNGYYGQAQGGQHHGHGGSGSGSGWHGGHGGHGHGNAYGHGHRR